VPDKIRGATEAFLIDKKLVDKSTVMFTGDVEIREYTLKLPVSVGSMVTADMVV